MKSYLLSISLLLLMGACTSLPPSEKDEMKLRGKVKAVSVRNYTATGAYGLFEKGDAYPFHDSDHHFTPRGSVTESVHYELSGGITQVKRFVHDHKERVVEQHNLDSLGELTSKLVHTYQKELKLSSEEFDAKGNLLNLVVRQYEKGKVVKEEHQMGNSQVTCRYVWDGSRLMEQQQLLPDGRSEFSVRYRYDSLGNQRLITQKGYAIFHEEERTHYPNGTIHTSYIQSGDSTKSYFYEYEYDAVGNWHRAVGYLAATQEAYWLIERFIEYYN